MSPLPQQPTIAELTILDVLWDCGPSTVRQVHDTLKKRKKSRTGYTTILKLLQIMTDKGLVVRDESHRSHVYRPHVSQQRTQRGMVKDLMDRAFSGSMSSLVLSALSAKPASADELEQIRRYLDSQENKRGKGKK